MINSASSTEIFRRTRGSVSSTVKRTFLYDWLIFWSVAPAAHLIAHLFLLLQEALSLARATCESSMSVPTTCPAPTSSAKPSVMVPGPHPQSSTFIPAFEVWKKKACVALRASPCYQRGCCRTITHRVLFALFGHNVSSLSACPKLGRLGGLRIFCDNFFDSS